MSHTKSAGTVTVHNSERRPPKDRVLVKIGLVAFPFDMTPTKGLRGSITCKGQMPAMTHLVGTEEGILDTVLTTTANKDKCKHKTQNEAKE